MNLVIRELTALDLGHGFLETLSSLAEVNLRVEEAMRIFQKRLRAGVHTYIALSHEQIVGTAAMFVEQKFIHSGGRVGHIEDVAVHREYQGQGVGGLLVEHAVAEAEKAGCYKVLLNCFEDRVPFYVRQGFRRHDVGMRKDF